MKRALLVLALLLPLVTACAQPAPVAPLSVETGIDPEAWVQVPAGPFLSGLKASEVTVDHDYEIMVTPVTNAQYARFLNAALSDGSAKIVDEQVVGYYPGDTFHGGRHEMRIDAGDWLYIDLNEPGLRLTFDGQDFAPQPGYENHPMTQVTWFGARAYCEACNGRLPTELEWEKAARGDDGRPYPWGVGIAPNQANYYASGDPFEEGRGARGDTNPVGYYNGRAYNGYQTLDARSPYGLYDMAGNVWQWTADIYEGMHVRSLRGGSHADRTPDLRVWARNNARPDYYSPSVGFRCAR